MKPESGRPQPPAPSAPVAALVNEAVLLHQKGRLEEARVLYEQVLSVDPLNFDALHLLGMILSKSEATALQGIELMGRALAVNPHGAVAYANRGFALAALGRHEEAALDYRAAVRIEPRHAKALCNLGISLRALHRHEEALASYREAIGIDPSFVAAHFNLANAQHDLGRQAEALAGFDGVLRLAPGMAQAWFGRGAALRAMNQNEQALASTEKALRIDPRLAEAWALLGDCLIQLRRYAQAAVSYGNALAINPERNFAAGFRLHAKMHICDWRDHEADVAGLLEKVGAGAKVSPGLPLLAMTDSAALQASAAKAWIAEKCPAPAAQNPILPREPHARLRVGYFSPDFCEHPVALLTAELFELHDRARFEVFAFSYGANTGDWMRKQLEVAFDRFIDVAGRTDREIAELARELEIDVAVDLAGLTSNAKPGVFALRAAPVQVSYIGYAGTSGAPFLDYLIADETLVPEQSRMHYTEQIAYVPCFQVNDRRRRISSRVFTREELGLDGASFVFCAFNQAYKIVPSVFDCWMRILAKVAGSQLLLYANDPAIQQALRARAQLRGVDPLRLVFAGRLPNEEHLARYRAADLFLDTFPLNGGATVSDALWAGLPVLTRAGEAFGSRMGASLLEAAGLPALVTSSEPAYEELAVDLALHPEKLASMAARLRAGRLACALFDTPRFTRHLEDVYRQMVERWHAGLPPTPLQSRTPG